MNEKIKNAILKDKLKIFNNIKKILIYQKIWKFHGFYLIIIIIKMRELKFLNVIFILLIGKKIQKM